MDPPPMPSAGRATDVVAVAVELPATPCRSIAWATSCSTRAKRAPHCSQTSLGGREGVAAGPCLAACRSAAASRSRADISPGAMRAGAGAGALVAETSARAPAGLVVSILRRVAERLASAARSAARDSAASAAAARALDRGVAGAAARARAAGAAEGLEKRLCMPLTRDPPRLSSEGADGAAAAAGAVPQLCASGWRCDKHTSRPQLGHLNVLEGPIVARHPWAGHVALGLRRPCALRLSGLQPELAMCRSNVTFTSSPVTSGTR